MQSNNQGQHQAPELAGAEEARASFICPSCTGAGTRASNGRVETCDECDGEGRFYGGDESAGEDVFGPVIHTYTRKEAIADGVLVDVTPMAREARFRVPVAVTRNVWAHYIDVPSGVEAQDEQGRLWDILWMCRYEIQSRRSPAAQAVYFRLHVKNDNRQGMPPIVRLKAVSGPGDNGEPVLTIMLPDED